ncbi:predicted protein [Sclerotinia sclerotiorum 1980 UF-70]|uniref:Uncharacterized protein n=1 Tax=Sclerotinia sclerotiorum (strain ATCC 18683 / 1980 / Ss-1) TaxID=665079 RepID=A7EHF9_SCLS1|nr:predicted protein [Sclerotinia sclerotiorum 1980 UF-70]EDO02275.1 predicted protein [Sclerotinia sclerotiorum 1980 UF-70]
MNPEESLRRKVDRDSFSPWIDALKFASRGPSWGEMKSGTVGALISLCPPETYLRKIKVLGTE